jgi:ABC-type Fe3+/spermidine/putrescine transport system ATPase subunit
MLKIEKLNKSFGQQVILRNLDLEVNRGEVMQISGPSGCGKTTLLRCISGLEQFESGTITLNNQIVQSNNVYISPPRRRIGMVFQDLALWPHMTVMQNIDFVSSSLITSKSDRQIWNTEILQAFKIDHKINNFPGEMSGGEQQRVALARALAGKPEVLLMDEPFSHLDDEVVSEILAELEDYINRNILTILSVSHNPFYFNSQDQIFKKLEELMDEYEK